MDSGIRSWNEDGSRYPAGQAHLLPLLGLPLSVILRSLFCCVIYSFLENGAVDLGWMTNKQPSSSRLHTTGVPCSVLRTLSFCILWAGYMALPLDVPHWEKELRLIFVIFTKAFGWQAGRTSRQLRKTVWTCLYRFLRQRVSRGMYAWDIASCGSFLMSLLVFGTGV
jgi:hypothetical protein